MSGYLGMFLLAWFMGWAFFVVLAVYIVFRYIREYDLLAKVEKYLEHLATFEENPAAVAR